MKVPDKIYAGFDENTHLESYCTEKKGKCQTEYIRKDALLELLKPEMDIAYSEDYDRGFIDGRTGLREELIDKIESL